jgi:nucleoside-diphosphate-sugar epimerase
MIEGRGAATAFEGRRVLITGGLGFIGSTLARELADAGARVVLVDSLIPDYGGNLFNIAGFEDRVTVNVADVRDQFAMNHLVKGQEVMFNLAGTLSHVDSMTDPQTDLDINCRSQLSILESCRTHNRDLKIVYAGTRGQYGRAQYLPVDECHPINPTDVNGINNHAGEGYHRLYNEVHGIRATSLRLTNTYGPRHQMNHHRQGIINWFVRLALEGRPITIYGDGTQVRDTNYVDDVVRALLLAGAAEETNGQVFNLGGDAVNLLQLAELISRLAESPGYCCTPYPTEAKAIEVGDYVADWSKAERVLGWRPQTTLEKGMAMTIDYYREHHRHYW